MLACIRKSSRAAAGFLLCAGLCATGVVRGEDAQESSGPKPPAWENMPGLAKQARDKVVVGEVCKAAEAGSAYAQAQMALIYTSGGYGVERDDAEAFRWFRRAAEGGNEWGQAVIAECYLKGSNGLEQDLDEAVKWFRKSAEQGNVFAQLCLGDLCMAGEGPGSLADSYKEAAMWYEKAALQGDAEAQEKLGGLYMAGQGVAKDPAEGLKWIRKAADGGNGLAQLALGDIYLSGAHGVAEDIGQATKLYKAAFDQHDVRVQYLAAQYFAAGRIGFSRNAKGATVYFLLAMRNNKPVRDLRYRHLRHEFMPGVFGYGTAQHEIEGMRFLMDMSGQGDPWAQLIMGELHMRGRGGFSWDEAKAAEIFGRLAERGMPEAQVALGFMHILGQGGLESSQAKAMEWFFKAAAQDFAPAQSALGMRYRHGNEKMRSDIEAAKWFKKAAHNRDADAQVALGEFYQRGKGGLPKSESMARKWYKRAAAAGNTGAKNNLEQMDRLQVRKQ